MNPVACLVVGTDGAVAAAAKAARAGIAPGGAVVAVVVGEEATANAVARCDVDEVRWVRVPEGVPAEAYAGPAAEAVAALSPSLLVAGGRPADRVLLAAAAARLGAPVLTGVSAVRVGGDGVRDLDRSVYGGIVEVTQRPTDVVALLVSSGGPGEGAPAPVVPVDGVAGPADPTPLTVLETTGRDAAGVNLEAAARVVAVGRGVRRREDLALVDALAAALPAAVACSRPLAEGLGWYPRDRYIGVSGRHVAPQLYLAVGISGEVQHLSGCRDAATLVSINKDPDALIVGACDYAVVGDLYDVLPALTAELGGAR